MKYPKCDVHTTHVLLYITLGWVWYTSLVNILYLTPRWAVHGPFVYSFKEKEEKKEFLQRSFLQNRQKLGNDSVFSSLWLLEKKWYRVGMTVLKVLGQNNKSVYIWKKIMQSFPRSSSARSGLKRGAIRSIQNRSIQITQHTKLHHPTLTTSK